MKYIKTFENINEIEIGDYVKINIFLYIPPSLKKYYHFINNNISIVNSIDDDLIECKYSNIPIDIKFCFIHSNNDAVRIHRDFIVDFAKTKQELEAKLLAKKYNL